jgi:hypothetical protein
MSTSGRRVALALAIALAIEAIVSAQQPAARPQPAVDPLTASIQGRVTTDSGAPIRRAEVRAISDSSINRLATTDADGRFELRDMPAGQFRLTVSKSGFVTLTYGQRRPFEAPTPIALKQGQRFTANIVLPRGGAIAGRVYDEAGEALSDVRVQALRSRMVQGRRRLQPVGPVDVTDDMGTFRLYGLSPGDYYVSASPQRRQVAVPAGAPLVGRVSAGDVMSTMTTFFPGTPSFEEAQRVTLGAGGEARADIQISPIRAAVVSGIVVTSNGEPVADAQVTLSSEAVAMGASAILAGPPPLMIGGHSGPDGSFTLPGVPPGPYTLHAMAHNPSPFTPGAQGGPQLPEMALMPLVVGNADITGLTLVTGGGGNVEGTFVPDAGVTAPLPTRLEVNVRSVTGGSPSLMMTGGNSTFRVMGFNGLAYLVVGGLPDGWAVKSIIVDGDDATDQPINLADGRNRTVRIVLTDRVTEVTGTIDGATAARDQPRRDSTIVVFPQDESKWTYPSRYLRTVRSDDQGGFRIRGLPPHERYLAVAVDYLEDGEGSDPEFLERIKDRAASFSLGEAERKALDLRLIQR